MKKYICWTYKNEKTKEGVNRLIKTYYGGYVDLKVFGTSTILYPTQEKAKQFNTIKDLKDELKRVVRKISEYKIEIVEVK